MSIKNNRNPNINKFFNKLYISFPNIKTIDKNQDLINKNNAKQIKHVYINKNNNKWFTKQQKNEQEIFLFGKITNNTIQKPLLILSFDKESTYCEKCSGIITSKQIYINIEYFIENYPNFKTKLPETKIDVLNNKYANSISVIKLGEYFDNIDKLLENLDCILTELENYVISKNIKPEESNDKKIEKNEANPSIRTCEICGKKLKKHKKKLCKKCSKKRHTANLLKKLLKYVEPQTPFIKKDLSQIFEEIEINDCIWSLEEFNLIKQNNEEYSLIEKDNLDKFIEKYSILDNKPIEEIKKEEPKKLNKKCSICEKTLPTSKFYKSKKTDDGLEDYCKKCKKYVNAANYLNDITQEIQPGTEFKVSDLSNNFKNPLEFIGRLWELQNYDLLTYNENKDTYTLTDLITCKKFLNQYYISESAVIKPKLKEKEKPKELTNEELMNVVIENIKNGKTEKEAAEIAGINLYKITHWFNEGKNKSGKENIDFYNRYTKAKKESKINSMKNFYTIESFTNKNDLTIADTLRKQQMENVLKELGSGSSMKTAAFNSSITYETLQYWYKRGKQNFGEEYAEFYDKINILQGPIDVPKPEINKKEKTNETEDDENNLPQLYEHILDQLPHKIKKLFRGVKENESGFAWVRKDKHRWRYERQQKENYQTISRKNIYELYLEVKKHDYIWGVRDLEKAKKTLKSCEIPSDDEIKEFDEDYSFKHILDPIHHKYNKRFRKPSSSGLAWVNKINNTWAYINPRDNIRIYDNNIYNLYIKVKKEKLPWGVRDLIKAKQSLGECEKPTNISESKEIFSKIPNKISCAYFENNKIIKALVSGPIDNTEIITTINYFKDFEKNIVRIITNHKEYNSELFIEFNIKKTELLKFKEKIEGLKFTTIQKQKNTSISEQEYTENEFLKDKSQNIVKLYNQLKEKIIENYENIEIKPYKLYISFKINDKTIISVTPRKQVITNWINLNKLNDYKNKTRDVSNIGHWGVGDYEYIIKTEEDINYLIELLKPINEEN